MTTRKKALFTTWLVYTLGGPDEPLGEVAAPTRQEAMTMAAGRWTGTLDIVPKACVATIRRRLERRLARDPRPLAYHEAGHAVVGRQWFCLDHTTIVPRPFSRAGRYDPDHDSAGTTAFLDTRPGWRYSVSTLAGPMSEFRYRGRADWRTVVGSDRVALDALGPDLARLKARTRRLLDALWPQVEVVAGALVEDRELCGDEVAYLLRGFTPPRRMRRLASLCVPGLSLAMNAHHG